MCVKSPSFLHLIKLCVMLSTPLFFPLQPATGVYFVFKKKSTFRIECELVLSHLFVSVCICVGISLERQQKDLIVVLRMVFYLT